MKPASERMWRYSVFAVMLACAGCAGEDGKRGRAGTDGQPGAQGAPGLRGPVGPPGVALDVAVAPCDVHELDNRDPPVEVLWAERRWPGVARADLLVIVGQARWADGAWTASYAGRSVVT